MADNWYIILELDFDPPVEDEQVISAKIDERAKFWSTHFNDFKFGAQYRAWHQGLPRIKKEMLGPANIRAQLAADACTQVYGPVDRLLKTIGRKGYITGEEGEKLAQKQKVSLDVVKRRAVKLGIKWDSSGGSKDYQATYDKYYKAKPQNAASFDGLKPMLAAFGVEDLYAFLYAGTDTKDGSKLPCDSLRQRSAERKKNEFFKNDSVSGTGAKLCGQCELTFKDESSKAVYDQYLEYVRRRAILDDARNIADISGTLSSEEYDVYIGQLTQLFRDRKLAEDVLVAFCKVEKIACPAIQADRPKLNVKVCRCGCINDVSDGRRVCSSCGLELEIKCPKCGTINDANIKVCKCGFRFENLDRALALCEQAEHAIDGLELTVARAHLSDAGRYWPGSSRVQALEGRLQEVEQRVGREVSKLRSAMQEKHYCEARSLYAGIRKLFSGYSDAAMEEEISQAIAKAQALLTQAKAARAEKDVFELCARAYEQCADLPGVKELMPPPAAVSGLSVTPDPLGHSNRVSWQGSGDRSIRYVLARSATGWIRQIAEGEVIYRGSASTYADSGIKPGLTYYYNVFAERAGVCSQAGKGESAVNLFEISHVALTAADASLRLSWDPLPENATAELYELSGGSKKYIASTSSDCYLFSGLRNGVSYSYQVQLAYQVGGKKQLTPGVSKSGVPDRPPAPIDTLRVVTAQDDNFEAVWEQENGQEVRLFCSTRKPAHELGDIIPLSTLEQEMRPLQQQPLPPKAQRELKPGQRGAAFRHSGTELLYITAAVVKSGSAVFGSLARACRGETVRISGIQPVNGKLYIYMTVPPTATGFVVLYRFDQFPTELGDRQAVRQYIPLKQYQLNSAIVLDTLEPRRYYVSVFAEFRRDGDKDYSAGAEQIFDNSPRENITYSIAVNRPLLGEKHILLEFEAEHPSFELPAIDIMSAVGNVPMFKASAQLLHSIPAQHVDGSLRVKLPLPKGLARNTYIKAFLQDEKAQAGNQLRLKLHSSYQIS